MKLEKCPYCGSENATHRKACGGYVCCRACATSGPSEDRDGEKWNTLSRRAHGQTEQTETGPMPWRLAIAAQYYAAYIANPGAGRYEIEGALRDADALIAAHRATVGGA